VVQVIKELEITPEQFIDVCVLCGCDYCPKIGGIGPTRALALIKKHGSIEKVGECAGGCRVGAWAEVWYWRWPRSTAESRR